MNAVTIAQHNSSEQVDVTNYRQADCVVANAGGIFKLFPWLTALAVQMLL